jgi:hypothetical protein
MTPRETLASPTSRSISKALATRVVLAHPRAAFHPCTCGLHGGATTVAVTLIGYNVVEVAAMTTTRRRRSWSPTSSTSIHDYVGLLLQLFFRCSARLVVTMIYDLFICKFPVYNGRCRASVAYPFSYTFPVSYLTTTPALVSHVSTQNLAFVFTLRPTHVVVVPSLL